MKVKRILFFLCLVYNVVAQTPASRPGSSRKAEIIVKTKAIVEEINHLKLLKTQYALSPEYADVYADEEGQIRKVIMYGGYPEANFLTIEYFDEEGNLCHLIFEEGDACEGGDYCPENTSMYQHCGNAYFRNKKLIALESKYWCGDDMVLISRNGIMLEESKYLDDGYHKNTQRLEDLIVERKKDTSCTLEIKKSTELFSFSKDSLKINDNVVVNANDVIIREEPGLKSGKENKFDSGLVVKIVEIGDPETIEKFGTHKWYKIEHWLGSGWIFGAFIEPVYFEYE